MALLLGLDFGFSTAGLRFGSVVGALTELLVSMS